MDWAKDYLGNLVAASGGHSSLGYRCPTCDEPVRRRAGPERRPHFAHYSHRAKPDCENFYPSIDVIYRSKKADQPTIKAVPRFLSGGGLLLSEGAKTRVFALILRLPVLSDQVARQGTINISSPGGVWQFTSEQLRTRRLISMEPSSPLGTCTGEQGAAEVAYFVDRELSLFDQSFNLFHAGEANPRLIPPEEPLEWGGTYRILAKDLPQPSEDVSDVLGFSKLSSLGHWSVYAVQLPRRLSSARPTVREQLHQFLRRRISPSAPRVYFSYPASHHILDDGRVCFQINDTPLVVRLTESAAISAKLYSETGPPRSLPVSRLQDDFYSIEGAISSAAEGVITIDGMERLFFVAGRFPRRYAAGLSVSLLGASWQLFEEPPVSDAELTATEIHIECPTERVAQYLHGNNEKWVREEARLVRRAGEGKYFSGGAFGALGTAFQYEVAVEKREVVAPSVFVAKSTWLLAVIGRQYGPVAASLVKEFLSSTTSREVGSLLPHIGPGWLAQILAAAKLSERRIN
jgi:hypothetical protein